MQPLCPAEQMALLDPRKAKAQEAIKVSLLSLVAQGALRIGETTKRGLLGSKTETAVFVAGEPKGNQPPEAALYRVVREMCPPQGAPIRDIATRVREAWGNTLDMFMKNYVLAGLAQRGLIEEQTRKVLWLFPVKSWGHTPAGLMEKQHIEGVIERARQIPGLLQSDPKAAAALVLAAGASLLLVPGIASYYGQLGALKPYYPHHDDHYHSSYGSSSSSSSYSGSSAPSSGANAAAQDNMAPLDFGKFDASAFDSLGSFSLDSFDSSFDSSFSSGGGDGGGDSGGGGGGDGGGGGGGD